jgi:hypothetical protein
LRQGGGLDNISIFLAVCLLFVVCAGLILMFCWERIYLVELRGRWDEVVVQRDDLRREVELLRVQLATTTSRELVETKAGEQCGLIYPGEGQLVFIEETSVPRIQADRERRGQESYVLIDHRPEGEPDPSIPEVHGVKANEKGTSQP